MELQDFLDHVNSGAPIEGGSPEHSFMHDAAQEAFRLTAELNATYRTPEQVLTASELAEHRAREAVVPPELRALDGPLSPEDRYDLDTYLGLPARALPALDEEPARV